MNTGAWKVGTSISVISCLLMLVFIFADARPALAQEACEVPAGVTPPEPSVTAQHVESGGATLEEFGLELRDQFRSQSRGITNLEQVAYFGCLVRQEGGPWRSGSTYLVQLTPDGRIFAHAKDMSLSGRLLHPLIYGQILIALGASATDVASLRDPATAADAYASILATLLQEPAALFDASAPMAGVSPGFPGASGHASVYFSPTWRVPFLVLTGFELNASHVFDEPIDYGDPTVTASDVVDRRTLKEFVTQAGNFFIESRKKGNVAALSKARIALRDPNGPWRHGSVYLYVLDLNSNVILVHGAFPNRFELKPLVPTVRDAVTGEFVLPQVIAAAKSDPEGGFLEYYWDDPTDDTDRADIPKVGYAREFTSQIQTTDGSVVPVNLIVGSGFYGTTAPAAVAGDPNTVIEAVLPQVMRAMTASTVDAVSSRIAQAASGTASQEMSLGGASTLADVLMANGEALENGTFDPGQLLSGSSFTLPLAAAGGAGSGPLGNLTLWGSGDWRNISGGNPQGVTYDGNVLSANLGVDTRLGEDLLAGVSLGRSRGSVDYTQSGALAGEFTTTVTSVTPYMGWQGTDGMSLWALAGHGWGEVEIEDAAGTQSSDMTQIVMAAGLSGTLVSSDELIEGGTTRLRMKGDAAFTEAEVDGSDTIEAVTLDAGRHRLTLEGSHTRRLESGATLTPSLEVGMRNDVGDGETGSGIEAGGGVRFADEATGITVEGRARTLLNHGGGSEEWGVSGLVRLDPGSAGRGLALSVRPAWGPSASGVERLWQAGVVPGAARESGRLEARVGYGMALLGGHATGTPEMALGLSEAGRDWRLGWTLGLARTERSSFHVSLEATRWEPANDDATPEHRVGITASMRW